MTVAWKIHWIDRYGQATIEVDNLERFVINYNHIKNDPECTDVWVEYLDDEEGWQA